MGGLTARNEALKVSPGIFYVEKSGFCMDSWIRNNDHDVCVQSEGIDKGREAAVTNLHPLKLGLSFAA